MSFDDEGKLTVSFDDSGNVIGDTPLITVQDRSEAEAAAERQEHIISLLRSIRALGIGLVILFLILGIAGAGLLRMSTETRDMVHRVTREQHAVLCDIYGRSERPLPRGLECP